MKLTPEKKKQFVDWLHDQGVNVDAFKCPVCAGHDFGVLDDIVYLTTITRLAYSNVGMICTRCSHVNLFNAVKSGIVK